MAQKVQILSTFAHKPDILILDEPFSGLDPVNQADLEHLIRAEHARGATILFSTHVMEHAERLCDRLILIACGRKMFDGTLTEAYATLDHSSADRDHAANRSGGFSCRVAFESRRLPDEEGETDRVWWEVSLPQGATSQDVLKTGD